VVGRRKFEIFLNIFIIAQISSKKSGAISIFMMMGTDHFICFLTSKVEFVTKNPKWRDFIPNGIR